MPTAAKWNGRRSAQQKIKLFKSKRHRKPASGMAVWKTMSVRVKHFGKTS